MAYNRAYTGPDYVASGTPDDTSSVQSGTLPPPRSTNDTLMMHQHQPLQQRPAFDCSSSNSDGIINTPWRDNNMKAAAMKVVYREQRRGINVPAVQVPSTAYAQRVANNNSDRNSSINNRNTTLDDTFEEIYTQEDRTTRQTSDVRRPLNRRFDDESYDEDYDSYDEDEDDSDDDEEEDVPRIPIISGRGSGHVLRDILYGTPRAGGPQPTRQQQEGQPHQWSPYQARERDRSLTNDSYVWSPHHSDVEQPSAHSSALHQQKTQHYRHRRHPSHHDRQRQLPLSGEYANGERWREPVSSHQHKRQPTADRFAADMAAPAASRVQHKAESFTTERERTPVQDAADWDSQRSDKMAHTPLPDDATPRRHQRHRYRHHHHQRHSPSSASRVRSETRRSTSRHERAPSEIRRRKKSKKHHHEEEEDERLEHSPSSPAAAHKAQTRKHRRKHEVGSDGMAKAERDKPNGKKAEGENEAGTQEQQPSDDAIDEVEAKAKKEKTHCFTCVGNSKDREEKKAKEKERKAEKAAKKEAEKAAKEEKKAAKKEAEKAAKEEKKAAKEAEKAAKEAEKAAKKKVDKEKKTKKEEEEEEEEEDKEGPSGGCCYVKKEKKSTKETEGAEKVMSGKQPRANTNTKSSSSRKKDGTVGKREKREPANTNGNAAATSPPLRRRRPPSSITSSSMVSSCSTSSYEFLDSSPRPRATGRRSATVERRHRESEGRSSRHRRRGGVENWSDVD
ncbi:hypothetical protein DQ04_01891010 [Trypanosoma grayi]|uniref:hypothetical protein n=1 Tax=Trypanosoma grayi TaxID=71804 RepID=UPI0004F496D5|nr:hypothetical protein DQ04_01891010 [Trypanosoma grayi]KEG12212.1 hypothetical protein DQ04_01891010 [Trypanosoma grayi]